MVILIAGGATGIGRAAVRAFRAQGDDVFLVDRNEPAARELAAEAAPGAIALDIRDLIEPAAPAAAVAAAVARFGRLDSLFVTAAQVTIAPLAEWTAEMWDRSAALNLRMPFLFAQAAAPYLAKSDNASLLFTSSTGALTGNPGLPGYNATKAALLGLGRSLAAELGGDGTRVNCLLPGWIDTPFNAPYWAAQPDPAAALAELHRKIPLGRQGLPEDVVGTILFLASPAARYITGTQVVIDGGYSIS